MAKDDDPQDKPSEEGPKGLLVLDGDTPPDVSHLKPKHFNYLEAVLKSMHEYQYRHIRAVKWREIGLWILVMTAFSCWQIFYVKNEGGVGVTGAILTYLWVLMATGAIAGISKSITRLYHFKYLLLRVVQVTSWILFFKIVAPYLLVLEEVLSGFGRTIEFLEGFQYIFLVFIVCIALVPFKYLKKATIGYFAAALVGFFSVMFSVDGFRHYVMSDNEVSVYSDFGSGRAKEVEVIDDMIDDLAEAF